MSIKQKIQHFFAPTKITGICFGLFVAMLIYTFIGLDIIPNWYGNFIVNIFFNFWYFFNHFLSSTSDTVWFYPTLVLLYSLVFIEMYVYACFVNFIVQKIKSIRSFPKKLPT
jgi:hypothetical protein